MTRRERGRLRRRLQPVRTRTTLVAALVTLVAVTSAGWFLVRSVEATQLAELRRQGEEEFDRVAEQLEAGEEIHLDDLGTALVWVWFEDPSGCAQSIWPPDPLTVTLVEDDMVSTVEVREDGGTTCHPTPDDLAGTADDVRVEWHGEDPPGPEAGGAAAGGNVEGSVVDAPATSTGTGTGTDDPSIERVSSTVRTPEGEGILHGILPTGEVNRSVAAVRRVFSWSLPIVVGLVALATWWLVGRALRPVEHIRLEAEAIGGATLDRRLPEPPAHDEVGRLARTMNAMLDRLDRSATRQRQFVADASHELRSPVANIRADLEVALLEGEDADWPTVASAVLAEEGRVEQLLRDLLLLAADDEGAVREQGRARVDLRQVVDGQTAVDRRRPVEVEPPVRGEAEAAVTGSATLLTRMVANLLDNATRHARCRVVVRLENLPAGAGEAAPGVQLLVDDDGSGIPPGDRARVFDRFVRLDAGRSRDEGGSGLGLAVVRSIVSRHHGQVRVEDSPLGGARLVVRLPAGQEPPPRSGPCRPAPRGHPASG